MNKPRSTKVNRFPKGWDEAKVRRVLRHYEGQSDEEAVREDEAAFHKPGATMMQVPTKLVPQVLRLIARKTGGL